MHSNYRNRESDHHHKKKPPGPQTQIIRNGNVDSTDRQHGNHRRPTRFRSHRGSDNAKDEGERFGLGLTGGLASIMDGLEVSPDTLPCAHALWEAARRKLVTHITKDMQAWESMFSSYRGKNLFVVSVQTELHFGIKCAPRRGAPNVPKRCNGPRERDA